MTTRIGFTGTQHGMTRMQQHSLRQILAHNSGAEFRHGDCIGADAEAHDIAEECGLEPIIFPSINAEKRAYKKAKRRASPLPPLDRNRLIVSESNTIVATPREYRERLRSGTWMTIRFAKRTRCPIIIIWPDGSYTSNAVGGFLGMSLTGLEGLLCRH